MILRLPGVGLATSQIQNKFLRIIFGDAHCTLHFAAYLEIFNQRCSLLFGGVEKHGEPSSAIMGDPSPV